MGVVGGSAKEYEPWRATVELTRGRGPFPTAMARAEVPSDVKEERERDGRQKIFLTTHFKYQGNAFLDMKIHPFQDRKEQLHLLFQGYLPMHRFHCRFEHFSNNFFIIGVAAPSKAPKKTNKSKRKVC